LLVTRGKCLGDEEVCDESGKGTEKKKGKESIWNQQPGWSLYSQITKKRSRTKLKRKL